MRYNPVQNHFTAGEISPLMYARSDMDGQSSGLKKCRNMITRIQGPVQKRQGFEHISLIEGNYARVFPFQLTRQSPLGEVFPVILSDNGTLQVFGAQGQSAGAQLVQNPLFVDGGSQWTVLNPGTSSIVFGNSRASVTVDTNDSHFAGVSQSFAVSPDDFNSVFSYEVSAPIPQNYVNFPPMVVRIGTTSGGAQIAESSQSSGTFNVGTNPTIHISVLFQGGNYDDIAISGEPVLAGTYTRTIDSVSVRTPPVSIGELIFSTNWDETDIRESWWAMPPNGDEMYLLTPRKQPYILRYDPSVDAWTFDVMSFAGRPESWQGESWPSCVTFFQGRAWWSGVEAEPEKIWGSVSAQSLGDFRTFRVGPDDDNSVVFTNARRGKINWIEGVRNLLFGTVYGEFIVTSSSGIITPADTSVEQQSANGSAVFQSLATGSSVLYASGDARKMRTAGYQWNEQSWVSRDITISNEHMSRDAVYVQVAYARNPYDLMWFVRSDGRFVGATVESFSSTIGWHQHETDGQVLSMASLEVGGTSRVYAIVRRENTLRLEAMSDQIRLDAFKATQFETPVSVVSGLDHLEGKQVSVVVDGSAQRPKTVSSGAITLDRAGVDVTVGLPFKAEIEPLPMEIPTRMGSMQPTTKRRAKFMVRVDSSVIPEINGVRPPVRRASTPMGTRQPYFSGLVEATNTGYDRDGLFLISDDTPFDLCVTGIYSQLEANEL